LLPVKATLDPVAQRRAVAVNGISAEHIEIDVTDLAYSAPFSAQFERREQFLIFKGATVPP
jgi:hypothetical protein